MPSSTAWDVGPPPWIAPMDSGVHDSLRLGTPKMMHDLGPGVCEDLRWTSASQGNRLWLMLFGRLR